MIGSALGGSRLFNRRFPRTINTSLDALVGRTLLCVGFECPVNSLSAAGRNLEAIPQPNSRNLQHAVHIFDVAFDIGNQILCRIDLPHFQCGTQGAGQSSGDTGDDVIERGGVLRSGHLPAILVLVESFDSTVNSEVDRFIEVLDVGCAMRAFVFFDANAACVGNGHGRLQFWLKQDPFLILTSQQVRASIDEAEFDLRSGTTS